MIADTKAPPKSNYNICIKAADENSILNEKFTIPTFLTSSKALDDQEVFYTVKFNRNSKKIGDALQNLSAEFKFTTQNACNTTPQK